MVYSPESTLVERLTAFEHPRDGSKDLRRTIREWLCKEDNGLCLGILNESAQ
jgi:hypothetical protein